MGKIREATKMLWKFVGKLLNCGRKPMDFRTPNLRVKELFHPLQVDTRVLFGCSDFKKVFRYSLIQTCSNLFDISKYNLTVLRLCCHGVAMSHPRSFV